MENNKLDAWGDHVEEYSKRQKQLHKELIDKKLMEMKLENTTSEKTNITDNNNTIQTQPDLIWTRRWKEYESNKTWWTETKLWIMSVLAMGILCGVIYIIVMHLFVFYAMLVVMGGILIYQIKRLIDLIYE
jgi:hypothetical protein